MAHLKLKTLLAICFFFASIDYINATPIVGIWSVEHANPRAHHYAPDPHSMVDAFESALKAASGGRFEVWPNQRVRQNLSRFCGSVFRHYNVGPLPNILLRIFASGFSDRLEIEVWVYTQVKLPNRMGSSKAVTIAASQTAVEPIDIITVINKLALEIADKIAYTRAAESQRRVLVTAFESRIDQVRLPVYVMFVTSLVQNHFAVLTYESAYRPAGCRGGTYKDEEDHNLEDLHHVDETRKKEILHYNKVDAVISGRVEEIVSYQTISTSLWDPFRHKEISSLQTQLGNRPEDVRRSSERAALRLLEEYTATSAGILLDIEMTIKAAPVSRTETVSIRGKKHTLDITLSPRDYLSTTQMGRWAWGRGDEESKPFAWLRLNVDGIDAGSIALDHSNIGSTSATSWTPKALPIHMKTGYGFDLVVYEVLPEVERSQSFLGERGTLRSVTIKLLVETE